MEIRTVQIGMFEMMAIVVLVIYFGQWLRNKLPVLKKYIKRIKHVHLKDLRLKVYEEVKKQNMSFLDAVRAGVFTVPGDGDVDLTSIFEVLAENNYEGYVLVEAEQDPAKANPFEYAVKARKYIKEVAGL